MSVALATRPARAAYGGYVRGAAVAFSLVVLYTLLASSLRRARELVHDGAVDRGRRAVTRRDRDA